MTGSCIIDGVDIASLGMLIVKGGDYDFLSFPERKEPQQNDWFEYDGLDADLTEVYLREKKVAVKFHASSEDANIFMTNLDALYSLLAAPGYRQVYVREFDRTFSLRYVSCPQFSQRGGLVNMGVKSSDLSVQFSMDDPLQIITSTELQPVSNGNPTYVELNGIELSRFGIIVNKVYNTVLRLPQPKEVLARSFERRTGLIADVAAVNHKEYNDIAVECTMSAGSRDEFYANYNALFNQLTIKQALQVAITERTYPCFYSKMESFRKLLPFSQRILVSFTIILKRI